MKRKVYYLVLLPSLILARIVTSAISCTIQSGSDPVYSVTLYNHHLTNTVAIFKNSHWLVNIGPGGTFTNSEFSPTDYVRVFNQSTSTYLRDATLNDTWHITGRVVFNYYGGLTITVTITL